MIPYETIVAAKKGDAVAAQNVLDYFDGYIDILCSHPFTDSAGHTGYGVDTQMKTILQGKLLHAVMTFNL